MRLCAFQVHLTGGSADHITINWASNSTLVTPNSTLQYAVAGSGVWSTATGPPGEIYSTLMDPRYPKTEGGCEGGANYTNPSCYYTSPTLHAVALPPLLSSTKYEFTIGGRAFKMATPPAAGADAITFGVVGDLGQTKNSTATVAALTAEAAAGSIDVLLHAGDLSYADGDGYRWDSYGRMMENLSSAIPVASVGGTWG
jgi:polygalacturonase